MEVWKEPKTVYHGKIFDVQAGTVSLDDGQEATRDIVIHHGGVGIIPYTGHSVILIKQYRIALEQYIIEIPAGKLEGNESAEFRGRMELVEEAGYEAGQMIATGFIHPSPGFLTEKIHLFIACDLKKVEAQPEWDESIEVIEIPVQEIQEKLDSGFFTDAKTIVGLYRLLAHIGEV